MPEISRFFGIVIQMYFNEHNPPHFHVRYNNYRAQIDIENFGIIDGHLPPKVFALVVEWAGIHQKELRKIGSTFEKTAASPQSIRWSSNELRSRRLLHSRLPNPPRF